MDTKEKTLADKVQELGFEVKFYALSPSRKRPEWVVLNKKRAVLAKVTREGRSLSVPYFYGSESREDIKPSVTDVVFSLTVETDSASLPFAEWCAELGFNPDSINDMITYSTAKQRRPKWVKVVGGEKLLEELKELANNY